jgi:hypothetical protein
MTRRAKTLRGSRRRQGEGPSPRAGLESAACSTGAYGPAAPEGKTPAPPVINGSSREAPSRVHPLKLVTIVRGVLRLASVAALPSIPQGQLPRDFREMGRSCEDWRRESLFREGQLDLRDRARIGQGNSGATWLRADRALPWSGADQSPTNRIRPNDHHGEPSIFILKMRPRLRSVIGGSSGI